MKVISRAIAKLDEHTFEVLKKSISSSFIKIIGMLMALGVSVFLGRTIGADGLGVVNLTQRIVNVLIVLCLLGVRQIIIREVAIAHVNGDQEYINNLVKSSMVVNGFFTILISIILIYSSEFISEVVFRDKRLCIPLIIALLAMIPQVISRILASALIGYRMIWQSNLVEQSLSIIVVGVYLFVLSVFHVKISIDNVALGYGIGRVFVLVAVSIIWNRVSINKHSFRMIARGLIKTSSPLILLGLSNILLSNMDLLIIGSFASSSDVGLYSVASRIALLSSFLLQVTNSAISPKVAYLFKADRMIELENLVQGVTKLLTILSIVIFLFILLFGKSILSIWGDEFSDAYLILLILSIGQLINIATGAVGVLLLMSGNEKLQVKISISVLLGSIFINILLANLFGVIGVAFGVAISVVILNVIKLIVVKRKLGISTSKIY